MDDAPAADDTPLSFGDSDPNCGPPLPMSRASSARASGERAMLRAMLLDAVQCLERQGCPKRRRERLASEARSWVMDCDDESPFSFQNVCVYLGLPAERLRRSLLRLADVRHVDDSVTLRRRSSGAEILARAERNLHIRSLRTSGLRPSELAERFGLSYESILLICAPPPAAGRAVA